MNDEQRPERYGDYLEALAFRILHQESVLQPRRAALFETENAAAIEYEAPAQFQIADLLRPAPVAFPAVEAVAPRIALSPAAIPQTPLAVAEAVKPRSRLDEPVESRTTTPSMPPAVSKDGATGQAAGVPAPRRSDIEAIGTENGRERVRLVLDSAPQIEMPRRSADPPPTITLMAPAISHEPRREQRSAAGGPVVASRMAATAEVQPRVVHVREKAVPVESPPLPARIAAPPNQAVMLARMVPETRNLSPLFKSAPNPPQDETTVEITIGRLEIRAASAPSAAPLKAAPRQPGRSLKEYLTRNAGGRT